MAGVSAARFAYRAEALAYIELARRADLVVQQDVIYQDTELDFLVSIGRDGVPTDKRFAVEVKACLSEDSWIKRTEGLLVSSLVFVEREVLALQHFDIPSCLFVYLIDTDEGFYAWITKPILTREGKRSLHYILENGLAQTPAVTGNGSSRSNGEGQSGVERRKILQLKVEFRTLDREALETIVDQVNSWYEARP